MSSEKNLLKLSLKKPFWERSKNLLSRDFFPGLSGMVYDAIRYGHDQFEGDISFDQLEGLVLDRYPALPNSSREELEEFIQDLEPLDPNPEIGASLLEGVWLRDKAKKMGEACIDVYTGEKESFSEVAKLLEVVNSGVLANHSETFQEVTDDLEALVAGMVQPAEFEFDLPTLKENITGLNRGNFGIIFARPEVGKTTFSSSLAADYIRQGHTVVYFGNEEPAARVKIRIACSYLGKSVHEISEGLDSAKEEWQEASARLKVFDSTATDISEIHDWVALNKPDVVFIDQLDKVKIIGDFSRPDERLKELYVQGRELAKGNDCLVWAVSQCSADGHNKPWIDFSQMDGSKTGKGGEADMIIGLTNTYGDEEDYIRNLCISKNKANGWHGMVTCSIDIERARFAP